MVDHKNHSFISNSKIRKFAFQILIFALPVMILLFVAELAVRNIPLETKLKAEYIEQNSESIEIVILGSSQTERAINPEYLDFPAINFSNSSQRIPENFELLKAYHEQLPNLKLVVLELPYDILFRDKAYTSEIIDQQNLIFYGVNTFNRSIKPQDYLLYPSKPSYFWERIKNFYFKEPIIKPNKFGFDTNKYFGTYQAKNHADSVIGPEDIFIENVNDQNAFEVNLDVLKQLIEFCKSKDIGLLIYNPPNHYKYNRLKDPLIVSQRDQVINELKDKYSWIKYYNQERNTSYGAIYFYNANHLNPDGARKATKDLNRFIKENFFVN